MMKSTTLLGHALSSSELPSSSGSSAASTPSPIASHDPSKNCCYFFMGFDLGTSGARISVIEKKRIPKLSHHNHDDDLDNDEKNKNKNKNKSSSKYNLDAYQEVYSNSVSYYDSYDDPKCWIAAVDTLLQETPTSIRARTKSICVSGTSASCLLVDAKTGKPSRGTRAKMYDYDIRNCLSVDTPAGVSKSAGLQPVSQINAAGVQVQKWMERHVPSTHVARSNTSALAKLLHYHACQPIQSFEVLAHQSEYVASTLLLSSEYKCGAGLKANQRQYVSDWHNALKLGYDVKMLKYPTWLMDCLNDQDVGIPSTVLPRVVEPGEPIGTVSSWAREKYGFSEETVVVGGTTDSNAAFMAATFLPGGGTHDGESSGMSLPSYGTAVTSLGSTLAIKMLSRTFVEDCERGVYSHRFPNGNGHGHGHESHGKHEKHGMHGTKGEPLWLVGGASNVGCAVLRQEEFSNEELVELSQDMDVTTDSDLSYYPLTKRGERFPFADGKKEPILEPKPESRTEYLKAILQGISKVERMGYDTLGELGANPSFPNVVMTAGGGSKNEKWLLMRQRLLGESSRVQTGGKEKGTFKVLKADHTEASFGAALLATLNFRGNDDDDDKEEDDDEKGNE